MISLGSVLIKKHGRTHKMDPLVERGELIHMNQNYVFVMFPDGREDSVSMRDLAPAEEEPAEEEEEEAEEPQTNPIDVPSASLQAPTPLSAAPQMMNATPLGTPNPPSIPTTPSRSTPLSAQTTHPPSEVPKDAETNIPWTCEQYQDYFKGVECNDTLWYIGWPRDTAPSLKTSDHQVDPEGPWYNAEIPTVCSLSSPGITL
ncbi:uncharacterized protein [Narcine bancroftii]|uniref:uncharacterized protein n=1 Tax=Narcine bancroftii TaxID=1343680 RepID=UPI003831B916